MPEVLNYDQIPLGTFFADGDLTPEQAAAIKHLERVGTQLIDECPEELAELARDVTLRYEDIAAILTPEEHEQFPEVAEKAVGFAIRQLIPEEELQDLTHERRSLRMKERMSQMGDAAFRAHQQAASQASWSRRTEPDIQANVQAMLEARGRTAWNSSEKELLQKLLDDPTYQHQEGSHAGKPNYELIAIELNIAFHDCEPVRHVNSVRSMRNEFRKQK